MKSVSTPIRKPSVARSTDIYYSSRQFAQILKRLNIADENTGYLDIVVATLRHTTGGAHKLFMYPGDI